MSETAARTTGIPSRAARLLSWGSRALVAATVLVTTVVGFAGTSWAAPELGF